MPVLAILAFSYAAAVALACFLLPFAWLPYLSAAFLVLGIALARMKRKWLRPAVLSILAIAFGFGWYAVHGLLTLERVRPLAGETLEVSGKVLAYPAVYDDYTSLQLRLEGEGLPAVSIRLTTEDPAAAALVPGDSVRCQAKLSLADERYGDRYDADLAKGIYLRAYGKSELQLSRGAFDLGTLPARLAHRVTELVQELFPADTAPFVKSLLMGDRRDLYEEVGLYHSLRRAGLTHIVAVSGMHVAFLVSLLQLLLGKNRISSLLCIALVWLFVLMTGAGPSAVRAGVMQTMLLLAPVFRRENDPVTSLAAALSLILLWNPYAVASVSLQLSFGAMAGIMCLSQRLDEALSLRLPDGLLSGPIRTGIGIFSSSLGVLVFTVPLMALHFGTVSVLAPVSNLLCLWSVSTIFCLSAASCAVGAILPVVGKGLAWLVSWLVRYLFLVAKLISSVPMAETYTDGPVGPAWLIFCYLFLAILLFGRIRPSLKILICVTAAMLSLLLTNAVVAREYRDAQGVFAAVDVGQGQCLAVMAGEDTVMVDCGGIYSLDNAGERAGAYLLSRGRTKIDALILTHLHADHCNGVPMLLEYADVGSILIPRDTPDEDHMLEEILNAADAHAVPVTYLDQDEAFHWGRIEASLFAPPDLGDVNERCLTGVISVGDYDMLFTGDAPKSVERELIENHDLRDLELLIVGHHGSRYSSSGELLGSIGADTAVISTGYNTFGHPTQEVLDRLEAYGYDIFRTDLNGTVEIRLG